eukprot:tig00021037_g17462.t1
MTEDTDPSSNSEAPLEQRRRRLERHPADPFPFTYVVREGVDRSLITALALESPLRGIAPVLEASEAAVACFELLHTNFNECARDAGTSRAEARLAIEREQISIEDLKLLLDLGSGAAAEDDGALVARLVDMGLGLDELFALLKYAVFLQARLSFCDGIGLAIRCRIWRKVLEDVLKSDEGLRRIWGADSDHDHRNWGMVYAREIVSLLPLGSGRTAWAFLEPLAERSRRHFGPSPAEGVAPASRSPPANKGPAAAAAAGGPPPQPYVYATAGPTAPLPDPRIAAACRLFETLRVALAAFDPYDAAVASEIRTREAQLPSSVFLGVLDPGSTGTLAGVPRFIAGVRRSAAALAACLPPDLLRAAAEAPRRRDDGRPSPALERLVHDFLASRLAAVLASCLRGADPPAPDASAIGEVAAIMRECPLGLVPARMLREQERPPSRRGARYDVEALLTGVSRLLAPIHGSWPGPSLHDAVPHIAKTAELFAGHIAEGLGEYQEARTYRAGLYLGGSRSDGSSAAPAQELQRLLVATFRRLENAHMRTCGLGIGTWARAHDHSPYTYMHNPLEVIDVDSDS